MTDEDLNPSRDLSPAPGGVSRTEAEDIERRMLSGEPFTYGGLVTARARQGKGGQTGDSDRLIDRTIQKLRRRGLIAFTRANGSVVWSLK
jgi:hypothetical protein